MRSEVVAFALCAAAVACSKSEGATARAEPPAIDAALLRPASSCTDDAGMRSTAVLDARVITAIRAKNVAEIQRLAGPSLDARATELIELDESTPYLGCEPTPTGINVHYGGADHGIHELHLHWTWRNERWELDNVNKWGW